MQNAINVGGKGSLSSCLVQYSVQKMINVLYLCFPLCDNNDNYYLILYRPTSDCKYVGSILQCAWTLGKYNYLIYKIADCINTELIIYDNTSTTWCEIFTIYDII